MNFNNNAMQKRLVYIFLFVVINLLLVLGHIAAFQSNMPKSSWLTMSIHAVLLILFPYKKVFGKKGGLPARLIKNDRE